jgi:hypothetical protein
MSYRLILSSFLIAYYLDCAETISLSGFEKITPIVDGNKLYGFSNSNMITSADSGNGVIVQVQASYSSGSNTLNSSETIKIQSPDNQVILTNGQGGFKTTLQTLTNIPTINTQITPLNLSYETFDLDRASTTILMSLEFIATSL